MPIWKLKFMHKMRCLKCRRKCITLNNQNIDFRFWREKKNYNAFHCIHVVRCTVFAMSHCCCCICMSLHVDSLRLRAHFVWKHFWRTSDDHLLAVCVCLFHSHSHSHRAIAVRIGHGLIVCCCVSAAAADVCHKRNLCSESKTSSGICTKRFWDKLVCAYAVCMCVRDVWLVCCSVFVLVLESSRQSPVDLRTMPRRNASFRFEHSSE